MKKLILVLIQSLVVTSCMINGDNKTNVPVEENKDEIVTGKEGIFATNEIQVGRIVCKALQNKIDKLRTVNLGRELLFQITDTSCPPKKIQKNDVLLRVTAPGVNLKYEVSGNYNGKFFEDIVTVRESTLSYFCPMILDNFYNEVPNFKNSGNDQRTVLKIRGSLENPTFEIYKFTIKANKELELNEKQTLNVATDNGDLEGNIYIQTLESKCEDKTNFSKLEQIYIP